MKFNEARKILQAANEAKAEIEKMASAAGIIAQNHFVQSFRNQGFTDEAIVRWAARKKADAGRAILVKSGALRRSLRVYNRGLFKVVIMSNLPYAQIQNDGGVIEKEFNRKILSFGSNGKFARQRTRKQRNAISFQQQVTINAHGIRIPARQFVGYSGSMNRKILRKFEEKINRIFNK